jgi:carboxyl-terminal processing protease
MLRNLFFMLMCTLSLAACSKDDAPPPTPTGPVTQQEINNWILDSMRIFYLWNDHLPAQANPQLQTIPFFNQLKYTEDRFSHIYDAADPGTIEKYMLFTYGIDFAVIPWSQAPGGALGVVRLVLPGSDAEQQGIKRGSYFTHINGAALNSSNAATLSGQMLAAQSATLTLAAVNGTEVTVKSPVSIQGGVIGENPIHKSFTRAAEGSTIAYLFYNYFNDNYSNDLLEAFRKFKSAGAQELILDMRYNPGGSVAAAAMLAALIAPGVNEESPFVKYSGNNRLGQRMISFKSALSVPESGTPVPFATLDPARLSLARVFILCGATTASAAELVINNLKPYTKVISIGQQTFGKDKGAITIQDMRTPKRISWVFWPIAYNLANAKGEGGYTQGIAPQYKVDELGKLPLQPLGNTGDPLFAKAISIIAGNGRLAGEERSRTVSRYYDSRQALSEASIVKLPAALVR